MTAAALDDIPGINTTTLVVHYLRGRGPHRLDAIFTIQGVIVGKALGRWVDVLMSEHHEPDMDASLEVWHHHDDGMIERTELTICRV